MAGHKLTEEHFGIFRAECLRLQAELGLSGWALHFHFRKLDVLASMQANSKRHVVAIALATTWPSHREPTGQNIRDSARHEMLHVLLARLVYWGTLRETDLEEMQSEEESVVNALVGWMGKL